MCLLDDFGFTNPANIEFFFMLTLVVHWCRLERPHVTNRVSLMPATTTLSGRSSTPAAQCAFARRLTLKIGRCVCSLRVACCLLRLVCLFDPDSAFAFRGAVFVLIFPVLACDGGYSRFNTISASSSYHKSSWIVCLSACLPVCLSHLCIHACMHPLPLLARLPL